MRAGDHVHSLGAKFVFHDDGGIVIEVAQEMRAALEQGDCNAEALEKLRELNRDRTSAEHDE